MKKRLLIIIFIAVAASVLLIFTSRGKSNYVYYHRTSEYMTEPSLQQSRVRLIGKIKPGSQRTSPENLDLWFDITDGKTEIPVYYHGVVPDTFQEDLEVVVDGRMGSKGTFIGHKLIVKCPSKYESSPDASGSKGPPR